MKILITGAAGFIGSNLADSLLRKNHDVIGIDNLAYGKKEQIPEDVEFHKLDIRDKEIYSLFKDVDYVFHLAAKNCLSDCQKDPLETADINITGTLNIFDAALKNNVKKVIYAETSALYENSNLLPTPETEIKPNGFYAISKACSHLFADGYKKFKGLNFTGLRYFNVYGPRQDYRRSIPPVMSAFIIKLLKNEAPIIYGNGKKKRDFIHVDDINDFHLLCLRDKRTDGKYFNLGTGRNYSILELYNMISKMLNVKISPVFKDNLEGEAFETLADITEARKIGWESKTDINSGLKTMIDYIKKEIEKGIIQ